jgi:hypothetical protein
MMTKAPDKPNGTLYAEEPAFLRLEGNLVWLLELDQVWILGRIGGIIGERMIEAA